MRLARSVTAGIVMLVITGSFFGNHGTGTKYNAIFSGTIGCKRYSANRHRCSNAPVWKSVLFCSLSAGHMAGWCSLACCAWS
ncbi:hypothetical protein [Megasphaera cerevisiae]|uniref:hypothetical protein n=1 Tax=Megasphaera cerevisiae TaxID=39029 RepID=UPI0015C55A56|nr:hypothetical protein [Megasphaera cerevisiae]